MDIIRRFESRVFHYGLIIAIVFRLVRLAHELIIDSPTSVVLIGVFNLFLIIVIFLLHRKHLEIALILFYCQILFTSVLTWNNAGGWNGSVPYLLMVVMVAVVITSQGLLQIMILTAYSVVILLLSYTSVLESFSTLNNNYGLLSREVDFFINTIILVLITFYLKGNFFSYRESVERTNGRLKEASIELIDQTDQLQQQQAELNILRSDLEKIILGKVNESQKKAEILKEYSFINAHHVRAPLARVLGLIDLIEIESQRGESSIALSKIKSDAEEIDLILKKIDSVVG